MKIGILKEPPGEQRVSLLPEGVKSLISLRVDVSVERDAGAGARFGNDKYTEAGAQVLERKDVIRSSALIIGIHPLPGEDYALMEPGQVYVGVLSPYTSTGLVKDLAERGLTVFSLDIIPRITRAQSMDVLSSMATVSGYKAVLDAANHLPNFFPMFMTAAGTIKPARVLILGAGVAGLQALATAKKLGAVVYAFDVRTAAREEVLSLGGKFVEVEGAAEDASAGGYAIEQSVDYKRRQKELIHQHAVSSEVVICTAQIPGRKAPLLITKETVEAMQPVSVIVDLAASTGGNCELTRNNEVYVHKGVTIIGNSNYPSEMPNHASKMFGNNVINFLKLIIGPEGELNLDFEDEIVKGTCVSHNREIINEKVREIINK